MTTLSQDERFCKTSPVKEIQHIDFITRLNGSDFWPEHKRWAKVIALKLSQLAHVCEGKERIGFIRRGERVAGCAGYLGVEFCPDCGKYRVKRASLCRDRACPICGALRAAKLANKIKARTEAAGGRYIVLVLTTPNVDHGELKDEIRAMSEGFTKFMKLKRFRGLFAGYVRTFEVTRSNKPGVKPWNPHINVLLRVEESYFRSALYVQQEEFLKLWNAAMGRDDIKDVYVKPADAGGVYEVCKYITKSSNLDGLRMEEFREWLNAVKGMRHWSAGGCLRVKDEEVEIKSDEIDDIDDEEAALKKTCADCGSYLQYVDMGDNENGEYLPLPFRVSWNFRKKKKKKRSVPNDN